MTVTHLRVAIVHSAAQARITSATRRTQARIGALLAHLRLMQDKQECRINRVHTAYLMDRLGVETRHLERLRQEAERLARVEGGASS